MAVVHEVGADSRTSIVARGHILVMGNSFLMLSVLDCLFFILNALVFFRPRVGGRGVISYNDLDDPGNDGF